MRARLRRSVDRGAALVEYAIVASLVVVVLIGVVGRLQDSSGDELSERASSIGHPSETVPPPGPSTTTTLAPPPTPTTASTTTLPPYNPTFTVSCTGPGGDRNLCSFVLSPAPPAVPVWAILPATGFSGFTLTGNDLSVQFDVEGTFSVRATVDGFEYPRTVDCRFTGGNLKCT
jgi:Flp pilus assembly pilin Flp